MVDRRALPGLGAGLAGLAFGVAGVMFEVPVLALAAAASALAAGASSLLQVKRLGQAEVDIAAGAALANLLDPPRAPRQAVPALIDEETGLPDERFFALAVEGRVATARRRLWPVTMVLLEVSLRPECQDRRARAKAHAEFSSLLRRTLRESDVVCRLNDTGFALVLEDTTEEGAVWVVERVQIAMAQAGGAARRVAAGVASYPVHGLDVDHVRAQAEAALTRACAAGQGRGLGQVEVAQPDFA